MKSNVININQDGGYLNEILTETQKISAYASLSNKQTLRLRLLAEELVGMLKELSGEYTGEFWIEHQDLKFELITDIVVCEVMDNKTKRAFIDVSSNKKNAAAKGIMGKIRDVVENMMYPENATIASANDFSNLGIDALLGEDTEKTGASHNAEALVDGLMMDNQWSLNQYKSKQQDKEEPWDEIEKSIIANLADDVTVSVKGKNVEIVITKRFA
ncbi:MAG: hypothetical protein IKT68_06830 [Clostridia bacterium]|nr:hypothetical protein [Clostridia bacterium]